MSGETREAMCRFYNGQVAPYYECDCYVCHLARQLTECTGVLVATADQRQEAEDKLAEAMEEIRQSHGSREMALGRAGCNCDRWCKEDADND